MEGLHSMELHGTIFHCVYSIVYTQYSIVYMYHIFFIHSPVDGNLGCFHVLAIVNSSDMTIRVHESF